MLANDPHLDLTTPSPLHVIHVHVPGLVDAVGACVPGVPALVSGRNRRAAWGITALSADVVDVYADTLSADGRSVRWRGGWSRLREAPFSMRYRVGPAKLPLIGQKRRYSPHGPVLVYDRKRRIAFSARTAWDDGEVRLDRLLGMERSADAREVAERFRTLVTPGLNAVAADVDGRVVYQAAGRVPRRSFTPRFGPLPDDGRFEWLGLVAPDSMPFWQAPADGFVVNGNNLPLADPVQWPRYDWAHDRALRMSERLAGDRSITLADLRSVQNDVYSKSAERILPRLLRAADSLASRQTPRTRAALAKLRAWDLRARRDAVAPTLYRAWYAALQRRSVLGNLQGLTAAALDGRAPEALRAADGTPERPAVAALAALDSALADLTQALGPQPSSWTWDRAHRARFGHSLGRAFEPPPVPADGDNGTVCVGASQLPRSTEFDHASVFRHLVDLAVPDSSLAVIPPGNAGEVTTGHARDHLVRWANHGYVPLLLDPRRIESTKEREERLVPVR